MNKIKSDLAEYRKEAGLPPNFKTLSLPERIANVYGDPITFPGERIVKFGKAGGMAYVITQSIEPSRKGCSVRFECGEIEGINQYDRAYSYIIDYIEKVRIS